MSVEEDSPETTTIFATLPSHFPILDTQDKIKTQQFLEAASSVVIIVEKLGKSFAPVISDMNGNIKKISATFEENVDEHQYIEDMILIQRDRGEKTAIEGLQWLRRGLHFASRFFQLIVEDAQANKNTQVLTPMLRNAYRETLERYHGWLGSQLFNILTRFAPTRRNFFYLLALEQHNRDEHVLRDMAEFTDRMYICVSKLMDFYAENNLETHDRV